MLLVAVACAPMASATRTGTIHDVKFEERMTPADLRVQVGDEVRWVNQRTTPVTVEFLEGALKDVVCQKGFASFVGRRQEAATINPNESASLCFGKAGTVSYNARMDSAVAGGQIIESGTIRVAR
jgi:plastocyanin